MKIKEDKKRLHKEEFSIQSIIMSVLTAVTLVTIVIMGFLLYHRFRQTIDKTVISDTEATVGSVSSGGDGNSQQFLQILCKQFS